MTQREAKLDDLLDQWEDALEQGKKPDLAELCKNCPDLLPELTQKIAALQKMNNCFDAHEKAPPKKRVNPAELSNVEIDSKLVELEFHDRGGLGVVYKAQDEKLHREVAVKFLNQRVALNQEERKRFQQEAEITGRLDHPGVVPVYASGINDKDQPFYVMRFIRGDTYDDAIKDFHKNKTKMSPADRRLALQKLLVQLVSVCKTLGYAHTRGIVHRDIKPKNIMLGRYGETLVVDWGIAIPFQRDGQFRVEDEKTLVPRSVENARSGREGEGTPVFMSPEQAAGQENLGPASDIYSLGNVLYRALTGKFAFDGSSTIEIKTSIMKGDFTPPRKLDRSIPPTLESICLKAMRLVPSDRYATATEFAEDLENFLADAPVNAYRYSFLEKAGRFIWQHQSLFTTILAAALITSGVFIFLSGKLFQMQTKSNSLLGAASRSQVESLEMTCAMTARSIQTNLEARLIAMEELANSGEFVNLVKNLSADNRQELFGILQSNRDALQVRLPSVSWFVLDIEGNLLCRVANENEQRSDQLHWTQPYFHGEEFALSVETNKPLAVVNKPVLSPVYFGTTQNRELCSLTVPIGSASESIVGVLVMELQMGQFDPLIEHESQSKNSSQRFASLVETRGALKGTLLHHPGVKDMDHSELKNVPVCESVFNSLVEIDCEQLQPQTISNYVDPLGEPFDGTWLSVAVPIQIRSRDNSSVSCGWYLMVQDRPFQVR